MELSHAAYVILAEKVFGVLSTDDAREVVRRTQEETGLPVTDPIRFGADPLVDAVRTAEAFRISRGIITRPPGEGARVFAG